MKKCSLAWALTLACTATQAQEFSAELQGQIQVTALVIPFDQAGHDLAKCGPATCYIDGQYATGAVGIPKTLLKSLTLRIDGISYSLDTSGMFTPLIRNLSENIDGFCYDKLNCAIRGTFSDAGGAYAAEWIIENGVPRRTVLTESLDLVQFISKTRIPPRYR